MENKTNRLAEGVALGTIFAVMTILATGLNRRIFTKSEARKIEKIHDILGGIYTKITGGGLGQKQIERQ
jgi:hypothetical protein